MTVETSRAAYAEIQPQIPEWKKRIISIMFERPGKPDWTVREIAAHIHSDSRNIAPRVHELEKDGKLFVARNRMCGITQRTVKAYRLYPEIILTKRMVPLNRKGECR